MRDPLPTRSEQPSLRRSTRVLIRVPVLVTGAFPDGTPFHEETHLVSISKFGAKMKTHLPLKTGMEVRVRSKARNQSAVFRVVWTGQKDSPRAGEVGIEYIELTNFLGINFPD